MTTATLLLAALALAGCSGPTSPATSASPNPENPDNVVVNEWGDLTQGAERAFTWDVTAPTPFYHVARFRLEFRLDRAPVSPAPPPVAQQLHYRLLDGAGHVVAAQENATVAAPAGSCLLCANPQGAPGTWRFEFGAGPSPASYGFSVDIVYGGGPG